MSSTDRRHCSVMMFYQLNWAWKKCRQLTRSQRIGPQKVGCESFDLRHEISNNVVCAPSKASVLIRAFASHMNFL